MRIALFDAGTLLVLINFFACSLAHGWQKNAVSGLWRKPKALWFARKRQAHE